MELLAQRDAHVLWHLRKGREISQMLLTRAEGEQRQLLGIATRMRRDQRPLVVCRAVEGLECVGGQGRFETRIGSAFNGRPRWQAP